jgi:hypothetical protein
MKTDTRLRAARPIALGIILGCALPALPGQESPALTQSDAAESAPVVAGERYDGYLFMDPDGNPLPFQSDEKIEEFIREAEVESVEAIPEGITRPRKVLLRHQGVQAHGAFKYLDETKKNVRDKTASRRRSKVYLTWRDSYIYDLAAYHLDRLLGMYRVPPIVLRKVKGGKGSVQIWLEGTLPEHARRERGIEPPAIARFNQQQAIHYLFNLLTANRDANLGNILIDGNWRFWFIDCSRCFGDSKDLLHLDAITHCERRLWKALKELDRASADTALSPYLTKTEINALFARRDKLVEHIQGLIDKSGEELILFDVQPPTETAPWFKR